jgi:hypothetical protein
MLALTLSACVSFLPDYREDLYGKLVAVQTELARLQTTLETNTQGAVSYGKVEPFYVNALADLAEAQGIANSQATYHRGKLAAVPARNSATAIGNCRTAVEADRARFQAEGQARNAADNIAVVRDICLISKQMIDLYKR